MNPLWRARDDALIAVVCAGIAKQFEWSVWAVRLVWVLVALVTLKIALLAYLVAALVLPVKGADQQPAGSDHPAIRPWAESSSERIQRLEREFQQLEDSLRQHRS